jgi:hypothetical protein
LALKIEAINTSETLGFFFNLHSITVHKISNSTKLSKKKCVSGWQGDSSREKEIEQKYKEKKNEPEESRYTKRYERNVRSKCEGE